MASGLVLDTPSGEHIIRWVRDDAISVGARELRRSFAVAAGMLIDDWPVASLAGLGEPELDRLLDAAPDVIVLGTGAAQRQLSQALLYRVLARGVGIEVMSNAAAARTYNVLLGEQRRVLAAFILPGAGC